MWFVSGAAMGDLLRSDSFPRFRAALPWLGLLLVAALSIPILLLERPPVAEVEPYSTDIAAWAAKAVVLGAMFAAIRLAVWSVGDDDPWAIWVELPFVVMAGLMAAWHWYHRDSGEFLGDWQRDMYFDILNHVREAPHQFRALPYGFTRVLEHVTGDWGFSCVAYRGFFTWWFLWGCYRFARLWFSGPLSLAAVLPVALLYPPSVWYYWGQLTDPLSHSLMVFGLIWVVRQKIGLLTVSLALGVLAKETAVLVVVVYWACHWRGGWRPLLTAIGLGLVCLAAFLAARLPFAWGLGFDKFNGTPGLLILDNLGIPPPDRRIQPGAPVYQLYLHPALFTLPFVPFIAWGWRRLDGRLKAMCLTLMPLLLLTTLCFGWMYESRNYMPGLPVLTTAALFAFAVPERRPGA
jgi:hypothetical protein